MASLTAVGESQLRVSLHRLLVQLDSLPTSDRHGTNQPVADLALLVQGWSSMAMDRRTSVQALVFQCFTRYLHTAIVPARLNPMLRLLSRHKDSTGARPWWPPLARWIHQLLASTATKPAAVRSLLWFLLACRSDWLAVPALTCTADSHAVSPETKELRSWVLNYCQACVGLGTTPEPTWGHDLEIVAACRKILAHAHLPIASPELANHSKKADASLDAYRSQLTRAIDGHIKAELVGLWLARQLHEIPPGQQKDQLMTVVHLYLWQFPSQLARCRVFLQLALPEDCLLSDLDWQARLGSLLFQTLVPTDIATVERQLISYMVRVWEHTDDLVPLPDLQSLWQSKRACWEATVVPLWSSGLESLPKVGALLLHWLQLAAPQQVLPILVAIGWLMQGMAVQPASITTLQAAETLQILSTTLVCFARDICKRPCAHRELGCHAYWMQLTLALLASCPPFPVDGSFKAPTYVSLPLAPVAQAHQACPMYLFQWSQMLRVLVAAVPETPRLMTWTAAAIGTGSAIAGECHPLIGVTAFPGASLAMWHQHLAHWALSLPVQMLALHRTALRQWLCLTTDELCSLSPTVSPGTPALTSAPPSVSEQWWALCILWTRLESLEISEGTLTNGSAL